VCYIAFLYNACLHVWRVQFNTGDTVYVGKLYVVPTTVKTVSFFETFSDKLVLVEKYLLPFVDAVELWMVFGLVALRLVCFVLFCVQRV